MKKNINWSYFPKTDPIPQELEEAINIFEKNFTRLNKSKFVLKKLLVRPTIAAV